MGSDFNQNSAFTTVNTIGELVQNVVPMISDIFIESESESESSDLDDDWEDHPELEIPYVQKWMPDRILLTKNIMPSGSSDHEWEKHRDLMSKILHPICELKYAVPEEIAGIYYMLTSVNDYHNGIKCKDGRNFYDFKMDNNGASCGFNFCKGNNLLDLFGTQPHLRVVRLHVNHPKFMMIANRVNDSWRANAVILSHKYNLYSIEGYKFFEQTCPDTHEYVATYLELAMKHKSRELISYLIAKLDLRGLDFADVYFFQVVAHAIENDDAETLISMHEVGFQLPDPETYVMKCCYLGSINVIKALDKYFIPNPVRFYGLRPKTMQLLAKKNRYEIIKYMVESYPIFRQPKVLVAAFWIAVMQKPVCIETALYIVSIDGAFKDDEMFITINKKSAFKKTLIKKYVKELSLIIPIKMNEAAQTFSFPTAGIKNLNIEQLSRLTEIIKILQ